MPVAVWLGFLAFVLALVFLDLGVFHRKAHAMGYKEALGWTGVWIAVALVFNVVVYFLYASNYVPHPEGHTGPQAGQTAAIDFFLGYVIEKSLSIDNIFVIALIFSYFRVPLQQQHRVLYWGILGAVILRGVMIGLGSALVEQFEWINFVFGALLLYSAYKMAFSHDDEAELDVEHNWLVRLTRWFFRTTNEFHGSRFFIVRDGVRYATPLFLALVLVESSDVMFAVDSIPAVFAITRDPFIVFTSNIFAILGLRSLYFVLAGLMEQFRYLKMALVVLLAFIGAKISAETFRHYQGHHGDLIDHWTSLFVIGLVLGTGIVASMLADRHDRKREERDAAEASSRGDSSDAGDPPAAGENGAEGSSAATDDGAPAAPDRVSGDPR